MTDLDQNHDDQPQPIEVPVFQPTAYHRALLTYLQDEEEDIWNWFSSHNVRSESADSVRIELLKSAYRIDRASAPDLYTLCDSVAKKMRLDVPVTVYQAQNATGLNASLAWLPDQAHVVLHGPVLETLDSAELSALFAHELAHHELFTAEDGAYLIVEKILAAMIADQAADAPHDRTWRSYRLYTELHCDRRAVDVTEDVDACVRALVKIETGLKEVSAKSYLDQASELLSKGVTESEGITHPEMFIRARALDAWDQDPDNADETIKSLVEGPLELKQLDLLRQKQIRELSNRFLQAYLNQTWLQTNLMLDHAKRFFEDFKLPDDSADVEALKSDLIDCDEQLKKYFCYVLLDFVTCDAELEEATLAAAFLFAEETGLADEFANLASEELKLGKRAFRRIQKEAEKLVSVAEKEFAE